MLLPTYTVSSPFVVPPRPALTRRGLFVLGVTLLPLRHWGRGFAADDDRLNAQIRPHTSEVRASWSPPTPARLGLAMLYKISVEKGTSTPGGREYLNDAGLSI
jgi:hypothetical protein